MADFQGIKKILKFMESSNGKNIDHATMEDGMHKGTSAMGEYGLMPKTAQDIVKNSDEPLDQIVKNADPTQVEEILKANPQAYERYVDKYLDKVVQKSPDPVEAAVRWHGGPNMKNDSVKRYIASDPNDYVTRTQNAMDVLHPMSEAPNVYDYIQELKDFNDFKTKKRDTLYNPMDLDENDVKLKIPRK